MTRLAGKAAIVTGGGTGVGRATALMLAREGASVLVNYSRSRDDAEKTAAEAEALGVKAIAVQADVSNDAQSREMVAAAVKAFGRVDMLVNNAGTTRFIAAPDLEKVADEDWIRTMSVNVMGPFHCARAVKEAMLAAGGGQIINIASTAGIAARGSSIPYAASKAALINLTISLARALAPKIRVNAIAPGFIDGAWLKSGFGENYDSIKQNVEKTNALGRVSQPEDIAAAIVGLLCGSAMVTGQVLVVDGGMLIGK